MLSSDAGLHKDSIIPAKKELEASLLIETFTTPDFRRHEATKYRIFEYKLIKRSHQ